MSPSAERAVDSEGAEHLLLVGEDAAVVAEGPLVELERVGLRTRAFGDDVAGFTGSLLAEFDASANTISFGPVSLPVIR